MNIKIYIAFSFTKAHVSTFAVL